MTATIAPIAHRSLSKVDSDQFQAVFGISYREYKSTQSAKVVTRHRVKLWWTPAEINSEKATGWSCSRWPPTMPPPQVSASPLVQEVHDIGNRLLGRLGVQALIPTYFIPYCGAFARRGRFIIGQAKIRRPGRHMQCHANASKVYRSGEFDCRIMTGFAMTEAGEWHAHTWAICRNGWVIETTFPFVAYFGVELSNSGSDLFSSAYCRDKPRRKTEAARSSRPRKPR